MLITGLWKLYSTVMSSNSTSLISGSSVYPLSVSYPISMDWARSVQTWQFRKVIPFVEPE